MSDKKITVLDLLDLDLKGHNSLNLHCIAGRMGLSRALTVPDINRPGLALSGFYDSFAYQRVQLFGRGEFAYLKKLNFEGNIETIKQFFSYGIPCAIFTHSITPDDTFLSIAEHAGCAILHSHLRIRSYENPLWASYRNQCLPPASLL